MMRMFVGKEKRAPSSKGMPPCTENRSMGSLVLFYRVHKPFIRREAARGTPAAVRLLHIRLVHVTPLPITRFERFHYRMSRILEMFGRVPAGCGIATCDVAAGKADAQFHGTLAGGSTLFAGRSAGSNLVVHLAEMIAFRHTCS